MGPGISDFNKKCSVCLGYIKACHPQIIVRIADKNNSLGVEFIRKEKLCEYGLSFRRDRKNIKFGISSHIKILNNRP